MYRKPTPKELFAIRQIRLGFKSLAEMHGAPRHIGAGKRNDSDVVFLYFTSPESMPAGEEYWLDTPDGEVCLLFHDIKSREDAAVLSRFILGEPEKKPGLLKRLFW